MSPCLGAVHPLLSHALHYEVAQLPAGLPALPHVPPRVEVQRVKHSKTLRCQLVIMSLPPVPKSLSPFSSSTPPKTRSRPVSVHRTPPKDPPPPPPVSAAAPSPSSLDSKLSVLRKEMAGLRQADVQLMNQLRSLQQSIQELRNVMASSPVRHHWDADGEVPRNNGGSLYYYPIEESVKRSGGSSAGSSVSSNSGMDRA